MIRVALLVGGLIVGLAAAAVLLARRPPDFYTRALEQSPEQVRQRSRDFLRHASQLASDVENLSHWEAAFRREDVNAWLSDQFMREFGRSLPPSFQEPRLDFEDGQVVLAFRNGTGWLAPVISLKLALWFPEPNLLAVELRDGQAGSIPVSITRAIHQAAARSPKPGWNIEWKEHQGNPVALVRLKWEKICKDLTVEEVRIEQGLLYVRGNSEGCDAGSKSSVNRQVLRLNPAKPPSAGL